MTGWVSKFLTELAVRMAREVTGSFWQTRQRKAQEQAALAFILFDSKKGADGRSRADEWPMATEGDIRHAVPENLRERYLRTFGRDGGEGLDAMVKRLEHYLEHQRPDPRQYGQGPIFVGLNWDVEV